MNTLQKCAEILVECGYADSYEIDRREHLRHNPPIIIIKLDSVVDNIRITCDPFSDTLEGRRQSDAIEDFLHINHPDLISRLFADGEIYKTNDKTHTEWRKFNLKWCIQEMIK